MWDQIMAFLFPLWACVPMVGILSFFSWNSNSFPHMLEMLPLAGFLFWCTLPLSSPQWGPWASHSLMGVWDFFTGISHGRIFAVELSVLSWATLYIYDFYNLYLFYFCKLSLLKIHSNFLNFQNNAAMHNNVQFCLLYPNLCSFE
jgi:hypothetical protein